MPVNNPTDDLLRIKQAQLLEVESVQKVVVPTINGSVFMSPSSYAYKEKNIFSFPIEELNPAWAYTAMDYDKEYLEGEIVFRSSRYTIGQRVPLHFPNTKYQDVIPSLPGEGGSGGSSIHDNVPLTYVGNIDPDDATPSITQSMVPDNIKIKQISLTEFEIEVTSDLTADAFFMTPISSPKTGSASVFGELGDESTLPPGSSVGVVKVKAEAKLTKEGGAWLVTGEEKETVTRPTFQVYRNESVISGQSSPEWYTNPFTTIEAQEQWQVIDKMVMERREIYAAGYECGVTTVGTGLFVKGDDNKPYTLPWRMAANGTGNRSSFSQDESAIKRSVKVRELVDCTAFMETMKVELTTGLQVADIGACIPLTAAENQVGQQWPENGISQISEGDALYPFPVEGMERQSTMQVTPLTMPAGDGYHCYTPQQTFTCGKRVELLNTRRADTDVNLIVTIPSSLNMMYETPNEEGEGETIPKVITLKAGLGTGSHSDPIGEYSKDWWGFNFYRYTRTWGEPYTGYYRTHSKMFAWWWNPESDVTFGTDTTKDNATMLPLCSDMVLVFMGVLKAGTPAGTYKFKPCKQYVKTRGAVDAVNPEFVASKMVGLPFNTSTKIPFIGLNLVTAIMDKFDWYRPKRNLTPYSDDQPTLEVYNTCERYGYNIVELPTVLNLQMRLLIDDPRVPLVGYSKKASSPTMTEVPENGEALCYVEDLAVTAPFFSIYDNLWVIVAASAELHMMYVLEVAMSDDGSYVQEVMRTIRTLPLHDCPYGEIQEVLGLTQFTEIRYEDGVETNTIALYVRIKSTDPVILSPLTIIMLRDDFTFDMTRDSVVQLPLNVSSGHREEINDPDINWPRGIAIMFPYLYVLGYYYSQTPSNPVNDPLLPPMPIGNLVGQGWQMCLWRTDVLEGSMPEIMPIGSNGHFRFYYGLPAQRNDYDAMFWEDKNTVGEYAKYLYGLPEHGAEDSWPAPVSNVLPKKSLEQLPCLTSLASISAQLICNHMGYTGPVIINPMTAFVEEWGMEQYPFSATYNHNVTAAREYLFANYPFGGKAIQSAHPFMHICIGDGLPPTPFSASIDIQDASFGRDLIRLAYVRNNLVRDLVSRVRLSVPDPDVLEHSDMLWLGLNKEGPWFKDIELPDIIRPCEMAKFFIKVSPEYEVVDAVNLYINAKFIRTTDFFGYRTSDEE